MYLCLSDTFSCYITWTLEEVLTHGQTHTPTCIQEHFRVHRHRHAHTARITGCTSTIPSMPFPSQQWQLWAPFDHRDRAVPLEDWDKATNFDFQPSFTRILTAAASPTKAWMLPTPQCSKLFYSAEHLSGVLQINDLFLMSQIAFWAFLAQLNHWKHPKSMFIVGMIYFGPVTVWMSDAVVNKQLKHSKLSEAKCNICAEEEGTVVEIFICHPTG